MIDMIFLYNCDKELKDVFNADVDIEFMTNYISVYPMWLNENNLTNVRWKEDKISPEDIFMCHQAFKSLSLKIDDSVKTHLQTKGGSCSIVDDTLIIRIKDY